MPALRDFRSKKPDEGFRFFQPGPPARARDTGSGISSGCAPLTRSRPGIGVYPDLSPAGSPGGGDVLPSGVSPVIRKAGVASYFPWIGRVPLSRGIVHPEMPGRPASAGSGLNVADPAAREVFPDQATDSPGSRAARRAAEDTRLPAASAIQRGMEDITPGIPARSWYQVAAARPMQ